MSIQTGPCEIVVQSKPCYVVHETDAKGGKWRHSYSCWGCQHLEVDADHAEKYGVGFCCAHPDMVEIYGCAQHNTTHNSVHRFEPPLVNDHFCPHLQRRVSEHNHLHSIHHANETFQWKQQERERELRMQQLEMDELNRELEEFEAARPRAVTA